MHLYFLKLRIDKTPHISDGPFNETLSVLFERRSVVNGKAIPVINNCK